MDDPINDWIKQKFIDNSKIQYLFKRSRFDSILSLITTPRC
jgi:hypothetical protein